ncbi:MAG: tetratricopeptide repeat protein [Bacteroidetes bacterium]|nr:tetratricopeptide repeat protein [Bacteroidota bacterium]
MLETEPSDLFLNYALGIEYFSNQNFNLALEFFDKVLLLNSDYLPVYYQLGKIHEELRDNNKALYFYKSGATLAKIKKDNKALNEFNEAVFLLEE